MSEETKKITDFEEIEIEKEYREMIEKAENSKKLSKEEVENLLKQAKQSIEFLKLIDNIKIPDEKHVVYTDGETQLIYENGEFFLTSAVDSTAQKQKIKRKQAIDLHIEYFIKYQLNPIIKAKKQATLKKEQSKTKTNARVRSKVSQDKDKEKLEISEKTKTRKTDKKDIQVNESNKKEGFEHELER